MGDLATGFVEPDAQDQFVDRVPFARVPNAARPLGGGGQRIYVAIGLALASDVEDAGAPCFAVAPALRLARRIGQPMRAVNDPAQRAPPIARYRR